MHCNDSTGGRGGSAVSQALILLPWLLALAGCAGSPPQQFYTLSTPGESLSRPETASYSIAVGPVTVPTIVDRPQIVLSTGSPRVTLSEQERWAEPLRESIPRVMADDLAKLLPEAFVSAYPQGALPNPDVKVVADVQRFDSSQGEAAIIDILWTVSAGKDDNRLTGRTFKREPTQGSDYAALVAAHRRALAAVSRDIAAAVSEKIKTKEGLSSQRRAPKPGASKDSL